MPPYSGSTSKSGYLLSEELGDINHSSGVLRQRHRETKRSYKQLWPTVQAGSGEPWRIGKIASRMASTSRFRKTKMPPPAPRRFLLGSMEAESTYPNAGGCRPVATNGAQCARSPCKWAPTWSAIARSAAKSIASAVGRSPRDDDRRSGLTYRVRYLVVVQACCWRSAAARTHGVEAHPRCASNARRLFGLSAATLPTLDPKMARKTAWFAWVAECGWALIFVIVGDREDPSGLRFDYLLGQVRRVPRPGSSALVGDPQPAPRTQEAMPCTQT